MNRFRRNLVKITNIFALLHRPHLHFTQVLNSCSCILPAAGRRPPGGSGELRSPAAVRQHRRACGRPPAPCTTRKRATTPTPLLPPHLPCRCPLRPAGTGGAAVRPSGAHSPRRSRGGRAPPGGCAAPSPYNLLQKHRPAPISPIRTGRSLSGCCHGSSVTVTASLGRAIKRARQVTVSTGS